MNFLLHINYYILPIMLLTVLSISMSRNAIQTMTGRTLKYILYSTLLMLCLDLFSCIFEGQDSIFLYGIVWTLKLIYFLICPLASIFWLEYVYYALYEKTILRVWGWQCKMLTAMLFVYAVFILSTPFTKWTFNIDSLCVQSRGPAFFIPYIMAYICSFIAAVLSLCNGLKEHLDSRRKQCFDMAGYIILPIFGSFLQIEFPDLYLTLPLTAISALMIFISNQNQQITKDSLTGLNNRGYFDRQLKDISLQKNNADIYLFILDLDHFKSINDTYGHTTGDQALFDAAQIITSVFTQKESFIARYGGDEFAVLQRCTCDTDAVAILKALDAAMDAFNQKTDMPYQLAISGGFSSVETIVNSAKGSSIRNLIRSADQMMYLNKKGKKI